MRIGVSKIKLLTSLYFLVICAIFFGVASSVLAAPTNIAPAAKISFTFDDGLASAITQAAPTLAKYGLSGTDYIITKCVGMTTIPNTCRANTDTSYMSWAQITSLQNTYGWEIGSHTQTHPYLATFDATDGQPKPLTQAQVVQEIVQSKTDLAAHGFNASDFSTPYGDYNNFTLAEIAKVYATHRGFADQNNNIWPYNDYLLNDFHVQEGTTVAQVEAKIDQAIAGKYWLTLTMHDIKTTPSSNPDDYEYSTKELDQIAAYVKAKQNAGLIQSVRVNQGTVTSDVNLLPNNSFDNGIANGWTTNSPSTITKDNLNNGSYPSPANSIKLTSSSVNGYLFSPKVAVDPTTTYMLKSFLNVQKITTGEVAFYIDEYDGFGNWISGQYKVAERSAYVEELNFAYKPSSAAVAKASLQVIVTGNSGVTGYLDNVQWFPIQVSATQTPPPTPTSLVPNGNFDAGLSGGWVTDNPTNIVANANNNGSPANPVNSIMLTATSKNTHLFSPQVTVDSTKSYSLSSYLNIKQLVSGEVAFYIDEYDGSGNWISGQYKTGISSQGAGVVTVNYVPSSVNVKKASLQIILVGNSGIVAYIDNVIWLQN